MDLSSRKPSVRSSIKGDAMPRPLHWDRPQAGQVASNATARPTGALAGSLCNAPDLPQAKTKTADPGTPGRPLDGAEAKRRRSGLAHPADAYDQGHGGEEHKPDIPTEGLGNVPPDQA